MKGLQLAHGLVLVVHELDLVAHGVVLVAHELLL